MAADSATLSYLTTLSLVLSPLPSLSSSISNSLASLTSLAPSSSPTKCSHCGTELVGGINGSFRLEKGAVWTTCEGCAWRMRREEVGEGRRAFARVKRRRVEVDGQSWSTTQVLGVGQDQGGRTATAAPPLAPTATSLPPTVPPKTPTQALPTRSLPLLTPLSAPSPTSRAKPIPPPSLPSPRPSASPSPVTTPQPSSDPSKKRKRTKQPSGLAQLLEAKRREKEGGGERAVGLQDFLAGM